MTVAFNNMESKRVCKFKNKASDFVYSFDPEMNKKEYIALPMENNLKVVTFQKAMKVTILIGQIFGLNPVLGIFKDNVSELRFTFNSGMLLYSIVSVIGQSMLALFCILKIFWETDASLESNSGGIIFFGSNSIISILFIRIAKKWPQLCRQVSKIEAIDPTIDKNLVWKCNITCIVFLSLAAVEHGLSDLLTISRIVACVPDKHPYGVFIEGSFYWIWVYIPYNKFFGFLAKFFTVQCTFNWNYSGVFVMCMCLYLTTRIQQINNRINDVRGQICPPSFWRTIREDYTKATRLVRQVDHLINSIIFVSFGSSLFSICILILHTLEEGIKTPVVFGVSPEKRLLGGYEHVTYYLFSIILLILRSLAMALVAARVNSTSAETALALYDVPSECFNVEVQRLIDQVHGDSVSLSGLKLFNIRRGMVLTIAAAIVTYELVLIQFDGANT